MCAGMLVLVSNVPGLVTIYTLALSPKHAGVHDVRHNAARLSALAC